MCRSPRGSGMTLDGRGEPLVRPTSVPFRSLREVPSMVRSVSKRGMPKPFAILIAALLALYFVPLGALPASAQTVGGFEIDGNLDARSAGDAPPARAPAPAAAAAAPPIDWAALTPGDAGFATDVDHTVGGQDATTFGSGSK